MSKQLPKNFDFVEAEPRLYKWWQDNGWFKPECADTDAEPFVISIPPPNVTGALHIGHALTATIEDLMIRYERMRGKAALWVPGSDHAGIATQLQVEKMLRDEGTSRQEIGREEFLKRTWDWKEQYGGTITSQLRRLGASCDWDRERFTLDNGLSAAVQNVFIRLYEQGLIYRGPRLVNWSPGLQTAVSDLEVERAEEQGKLYFFKYPIEGGGHIPVATTRPETILGDTAVAVHPEDERYSEYIGKTALVPILDRPIPVIADEYVDRKFGTGALKVTPGHDFNDYEIGLRHDLSVVNILNRDATLNESAGPYAGLDRFKCRDKLWSDMDTAGLTLRVEEHTHTVPRSQRGGEVVEPMISTQWFVQVKPLAEQALAAVRDGRIRIVPEHFTKVYYHWLENIEDWCISRQLWWGHRIPAWYTNDGDLHVGKMPPPDNGKEWIPEEDVLDTWFSSGLWPFSTLGWPEDTEDFQRFYPTSVMETGYDILFFWVARMIMLGLWFTDDIPFHTVYLHGLVRDKHGRKISKTLGNTIDPVDLIDQYGADPIRFTLVTSGTPGNDVNLDAARIESNWHFINKIWQIANFTVANLAGKPDPGTPPIEQLDMPSRWILSRLTQLIDGVQRLFDSYQYGEAGRQIYDFVWHEFADWYIEISKHLLYGDEENLKEDTRRVLIYVLDTCLRMLHPFIPFASEEIWQHIPHEGEALIIAPWPQANDAYLDTQAEAEMALFIDLVKGIRNARKDYNVDPGRRITASVAPGSHHEILDTYRYIFARLCNVEHIQFIAANDPVSENAATVVADDVTVFLPLSGMIDVAAERKRLRKEQERLQTQIDRSEAMLTNESFLTKAKPEVVDRERAKLTTLQAEAMQIMERLQALQ